MTRSPGSNGAGISAPSMGRRTANRRIDTTPGFLSGHLLHAARERLAQREPRAVQARLHGGDAEVEDLRDLLRREVLELAQDEDRAVRLGKRVDRLRRVQGELALDDAIVDRGGPVVDGLGDLAAVGVARRRLFERSLVVPALHAQPHERRVHRDAMEPRGERALRLELIDLAEHLQERVLERVLGERLVAREPERHAEEARLVTRDDLAEGGAIAGLQATN